ncbi:MAG: T9SS type A sorting domain-containing protein, partial [Chlorobi bacterium]|nr:T9SS type A sorting domain-containing protein [Chlorobiota bacterium]
IKSTNTGWDVTQKYYTPAGKYTVEFTDTNYFVSGKRGKATMYNYFDLSLYDALPPVFNALQIRNSNGKPCELLKTNEQATIHFSLADTYFGAFRNLYYQSILLDSTKVFVKQYQTEEWTEIPYNIITEDIIEYGSDGGYYMIAQIPEAFTSFDSSAIDLRIVFQDSSYNKTDYSLEPAVAVGNFKFPYYMPLAVTDYYQIMQDSFLIITTDNSVLANDTCEEYFGLAAKLVSQPSHGTVDFNSNGTFAYYPLPGYRGDDSFLYQALNGGIIPSISQKVNIDVISTSLITPYGINNTELYQNVPNPFSDKTTINYCLNENSQIDISVFSQHGKKVAILVNGIITQGRHSITWNGKNNYGKLLSSGIYYCRITTKHKTISKKMILIR